MARHNTLVAVVHQADRAEWAVIHHQMYDHQSDLAHDHVDETFVRAELAAIAELASVRHVQERWELFEPALTSQGQYSWKTHYAQRYDTW